MKLLDIILKQTSVIKYSKLKRKLKMVVKKIVFASSVVGIYFLVISQIASAACYTDYKAKKNQPLKLHYGVMKLYENDCMDESQRDRDNRVALRLRIAGWQLLGVLTAFDDSGLEQRKESAGQYYLRF